MNKAEKVVNDTLQFYKDTGQIALYRRTAQNKYDSAPIDFYYINNTCSKAHFIEVKQRDMDNQKKIYRGDFSEGQQELFSCLKFGKPKTNGVTLWLIARFYTAKIHGNSKDFEEHYCLYPGYYFNNYPMGFSLEGSIRLRYDKEEGRLKGLYNKIQHLCS